MRYRGTLAYDGTAYQGFQRQRADRPTIQGTVEQAILAVTQQDEVTVLGAGRTDVGVHATGQVIAFDVDGWQHGTRALLRAVNARLPADIALQDLCEQPGFHPRFDAVSRLYRYRVALVRQRHPLLRLTTWQLWMAQAQQLDGEAMQQAAALMMGKQDFAALGNPPQGDNTVRTVFHSEWTVEAVADRRMWTYTVEADAFLQHMVRRMVALQVAVGLRRMTLEHLTGLMARKQLVEAVSLAPPQGLTLEAVRYSE
jgi:tRNA pseudouridine38-40 synthase